MMTSAIHASISSDLNDTVAYPLPSIEIDSKRVQEELRALDEELWTLQNRYKAVERWKGISLFSVGGEATDLRVADRLPVYKTVAGEKCPYICNEVLPRFGAPWLRVVFYRLEAKTQIAPHRDLGHNRILNGPVRIHIPVITNPQVLMYLDGRPYHFSTGTAWYFDATARHSVENNSDQDRIHLVVDLKPCEATHRLLKPLTAGNRVRFSCFVMLHYLKLIQAFVTFMPTREGRARILARMAVVLGKARRAA
jgi:hypothetical protein